MFLTFFFLMIFPFPDNERTSSNTCVIQDDVMSIKPAPGEGGMKAKPRPNSAHGNRNLKLREAVRKTSNLASAAGELANVSEQLASEFEKENGNMNVFTALKKAINLEGTSQSRVKELSMPGRKKGNFPWNH